MLLLQATAENLDDYKEFGNLIQTAALFSVIIFGIFGNAVNHNLIPIFLKIDENIENKDN